MQKIPIPLVEKRSFLLVGFLGLLLVTGCVRVKTEPIQVEPIYIEITVNHRIQKELDSYFRELDQMSETSQYKPLEEDASEPGS